MNFIIRNLSQRNLFLFYLAIAYLFGPILALSLPLSGEEFRYEFNFFSIVFDLSIAVTSFILSYWFFKKLIISKSTFLSSIQSKSSTNELYYTGVTLCAISLSALAIYIFKNGLSLGWETYETRYYNNIGAGLITKLFVMFPIGFLIALCSGKIKINKYKHGAIIFLYGLLLTFATGGYRQIMLIGIISFLLIAYLTKSISKKEVQIIALASIVAVSVIGALRNAGIDHDGEISLTQHIYAVIDSFAPFDSYLKIKDYVDHHGAPGISVFTNHFLSYIPRALWDEKPFLVLNAGNFFTIFILNYTRDVTISPTVLGEFYLMGGWFGIVGGCTLTAFVLATFDTMFSPKKTVIGAAFFIFFFYAPFGLVREGLAVYITTLLWILSIFLVCFALVKLAIKSSKRH